MPQGANVVVQTQKIIVNPSTKAVAVINAGPQGPPGPPGSAGPPGPGVPNEYVKANGSIPMTGALTTTDVILPGGNTGARLTSLETASANSVKKTGAQTMTGALTTPALWLPTNGEVDASLSAILASLATKAPSSSLTSYLPLAGGTMSGTLTNPGAINAGIIQVGSDGGSVIPIRLLGINGTGYVGFYPDASGLSSIGTRAGYVGVVSGHMRLIAEGSQQIQIGVAATPNYVITAGGDHLWDGGSMSYLTSSDILTLLSNESSLRVARAGNAPFIAWYDSTYATRYGYVQMSATSGSLHLASAGPWLFATGGVEEMRLDNTGNLFHGKTASNAALLGIEFLTTGTIQATRLDAGTPYVCNKQVGAASGSPMFSFRVDNTQIGSISRNAATSAVLYNTTSDANWKGNVEDLDDDEAIARVEKWRPVAFQWKTDENNNPTKFGTPKGEVQHGFIAQEMNEINPNAVNEGFGTEEEHQAWLLEHEAYRAVVNQYNEILAEHDVIMEAYSEECVRIQEEARLQHAAQVEEILSEHRRTLETGLILPDPELPVFERPSIPEPVLPELPVIPAQPTDIDPYQAWSGDWTQLVPDLSAAVQALIRQNRALTERIEELERSSR